VIKRVVLSAQAQADLAALDRAVALRVIAAIQRFAATGAGNVQGLRGIHPPESAFTTMEIGSTSSASVTAKTLTAEIFDQVPDRISRCQFFRRIRLLSFLASHLLPQ
jgi:hypothetical protein